MSELLTTRLLHRSPFELEGMGFAMPDVPDHPNRSPFTATLTRIEEPSTRPPGGSSGHRVLLTRAAAEAALPSLIGMAVNCSQDFSDHSKRTKIGVITEAHIDGKDLVISGHLYEKDFEAEVNYIRANKAQMGASYEISDVSVSDPSADIWQIDHLVFTGAALLLKDKAAYAKSSVIAAQAEDVTMSEQLLDKLRTLDAKLDGIQAAMESDDAQTAAADEEAAASQDAAATAAMTAAQRARADADEEDAAAQEELAAKCHTEAFSRRMKASQWHASMATKAQEAGSADEAKTHQEAAARLQAAAEASQKAAADIRAQLAAREAQAEADVEGSEDETLMARMFQAMLDGGQVSAGGGDPLRMGRMMAAMVKAMTFQPGVSMGKKKMAAAQHDDEAEDKALIRRMLKQDRGNMNASRTPAADLSLKRTIRQMQASIELLTDTVSKMAGLLTDRTAGGRNLATDNASSSPNGGAAPTRRSMQGGGGEQWADKYAQVRDGQNGKKTQQEYTNELTARGITDPRDQMTELLMAQERGELILQ